MKLRSDRFIRVPTEKGTLSKIINLKIDLLWKLMGIKRGEPKMKKRRGDLERTDITTS